MPVREGEAGARSHELHQRGAREVSAIIKREDGEEPQEPRGRRNGVGAEISNFDARNRIEIGFELPNLPPNGTIFANEVAEIGTNPKQTPENTLGE